jgi:hypothetical protein
LFTNGQTPWCLPIFFARAVSAECIASRLQAQGLFAGFRYILAMYGEVEVCGATGLYSANEGVTLNTKQIGCYSTLNIGTIARKSFFLFAVLWLSFIFTIRQ